MTLTKNDGEESVTPKDGDTITLSFATQNDQKSVDTIKLVYSVRQPVAD